MLSAAWGSHGESTVARHEWKGLSKMNNKLEDWVEKTKAETVERQALGRPLPGAFQDSDDDDEYIPTDEDDSE